MYATRQNKEPASRMIERPVKRNVHQFNMIHNTKYDISNGNTIPFSFIGNHTIQRSTQILSQQSRKYVYGSGKEVETGSLVKVGLDPYDMRQGQSAVLNWGQDEMMKCIRKKWHIKGGDVVKGHLWNDNLGGYAWNNNLYPITKAANSDHLG